MRARNAGVAIALTLTVTVVSVVAGAAVPARAAPPQFDTGAGVPTISNFQPVTLNGNDQLTSAGIAPFVIDDDSGALAGWHVTLQVPNFQNGTGADCSTDATGSISGSNVSMNAPTVTAADVDTSMTGVTAAGFRDFTAARTIVSAAAGAGAGTYDVAPEIVQLVVPADAIAGTYCSQATIAITSGP